MSFDFKAWLRDDRSPGNFTVHPDYDALPDCIKHTYSSQDFAWMTETQRDRIIESECYPEPDGEDD